MNSESIAGSMRSACALLLALSVWPAHADTVQARCEVHPKVKGTPVKVVPCTFSQRQGYVGIDRADGVRHDLSPQGDRPGVYADERGRPAYRQKGLGSRGQIYRLADESLYVYWETKGLPAEKAGAAGAGGPTPAGTAAHGATRRVPFKETLALQGIRFQVSSANDSSINEVRIQPSGLEVDNRPIVRTIEGTITGAEVADLNADGSPELYLFVTSAGSGSYGSVVAYAGNRRKSLSEIYLPPLADGSKAAEGYMGHDEFAIVENVLARRFPVYRPGDSNARPTGGTRQLTYRLVPGEAGWILKLDKVEDR
jgi:hypothetical protein